MDEYLAKPLTKKERTGWFIDAATSFPQRITGSL